jgi:hypothetical protein
MLTTVTTANASATMLPVAMPSLHHLSNKETVKRTLYVHKIGCWPLFTTS